MEFKSDFKLAVPSTYCRYHMYSNFLFILRISIYLRLLSFSTIIQT